MFRLRQQLGHQAHHEHKESNRYDTSSSCPLWTLWFTWIRRPTCLGTKASPTDRIRQSKHHPFAPFASSCEKISSKRTPTKQPVRKGCFLLLMVIFSKKIDGRFLAKWKPR